MTDSASRSLARQDFQELLNRLIGNPQAGPNVTAIMAEYDRWAKEKERLQNENDQLRSTATQEKQSLMEAKIQLSGELVKTRTELGTLKRDLAWAKKAIRKLRRKQTFLEGKVAGVKDAAKEFVNMMRYE